MKNKKLQIATFLFWISSIFIWQILFYKNEIIAPILWEIHTIFSCTILFFSLLYFSLKEEILNYLKIIFRIIFKVWIVIFISFSMQHDFNQKGFVLTATFVFGYFEGLIETSQWLKTSQFQFLNRFSNLLNTKAERFFRSIILISIIHSICACITFLFFKI